MGGKNYITPAGYARLRAELLGLMDEERPKVVEAVHWAAKNGDRSENGDYLYGKKRLREIDRRIRFLTKRLEIAEVTDPSALHITVLENQGAQWGYASADDQARIQRDYREMFNPSSPAWRTKVIADSRALLARAMAQYATVQP